MARRARRAAPLEVLQAPQTHPSSERAVRSRGSLRTLIGSLFGGLALLSATAVAQAPVEAPQHVWELAPGTILPVGARDVVVPDTDAEAWIATRRAAGLVDVSVAALDVAAATRLVEVDDEASIAWERAWVAFDARHGGVDVWEADLWLDALSSNPAPGATAASTAQRVLWTALHVRGAAATVLPPRCMPESPELLVSLFDTGAPAERRFASDYEVLTGLPDDATVTAALDGAGGGAVAATLGFIASAFPAVPVREVAVPGCDPRAVIGAAAWGLANRDDWPRVRDGVRALFATGPVPHRLTRRAALHWYLQTWPEPITELAALAEQAESRPTEVALLRGLAAGAAGDADAMRQALDGLDASGDPFVAWALAESARQSGDADRAVDLSRAATDADNFFFAAYLTRASALIALGREDTALADLEFVRRTFSGNAVYGPWVERLARRLR